MLQIRKTQSHRANIKPSGEINSFQSYLGKNIKREM